jgi:hypothetical protein
MNPAAAVRGPKHSATASFHAWRHSRSGGHPGGSDSVQSRSTVGDPRLGDREIIRATSHARPPLGANTIAAAWRSIAGDAPTSHVASARSLPSSRASIKASASRRSSRRSAISSRARARFSRSRDQDVVSNVSRAARIAARACATPPSAKGPSTSPVEGLRDSPTFSDVCHSWDRCAWRDSPRRPSARRGRRINTPQLCMLSDAHVPQRLQGGSCSISPLKAFHSVCRATARRRHRPRDPAARRPR